MNTAHWNHFNGIFKCSNCEYGFEHEGYVHFFHYCPCCGAEITGVQDEDESVSEAIPKDFKMKLKKKIHAIFRMYDMDRGETNAKRQEHLLKYCLTDIHKHTDLIKELSDDKHLTVYVIQSMIYLIE